VAVPQGDGSNTTTDSWVSQPASPAPNTTASPVAQEQLVGSNGSAATGPSDIATSASPAAEEQQGNDNTTNASPAADEVAITPPSTAAEQQQPASDIDAAVELPADSDSADIEEPSSPAPVELEDGDTSVGYAVHTPPSKSATTPAPSSPLPEQQPAANSSSTSAEPTSTNAAAPTATPEPSAGLQNSNTDNTTVAAASAPDAMVDPQPSPIVENLQGNAAALPTSSPIVVDLSAGSDKISSTIEPFAHVAAVLPEDVALLQNDAPVYDISMVGPEGATVADLSNRSAGVQERGQANKASSNDSATNGSKNDMASQNDFSVTELVSIAYTSLNSTS
jgi:hypothetical protein